MRKRGNRDRAIRELLETFSKRTNERIEDLLDFSKNTKEENRKKKKKGEEKMREYHFRCAFNLKIHESPFFGNVSNFPSFEKKLFHPSSSPLPVAYILSQPFCCSLYVSLSLFSPSLPFVVSSGEKEFPELGEDRSAIVILVFRERKLETKRKTEVVKRSEICETF